MGRSYLPPWGLHKALPAHRKTIYVTNKFCLQGTVRPVAVGAGRWLPGGCAEQKLPQLDLTAGAFMTTPADWFATGFWMTPAVRLSVHVSC